jgi:hypothetical protein
MEANRIVEQQKLHRIMEQLAKCLAELRELPVPEDNHNMRSLNFGTSLVKEAMSQLGVLLYDEADR